MNNWSKSLGLNTAPGGGYSFADCYGLDPELLAFVSKPGTSFSRFEAGVTKLILVALFATNDSQGGIDVVSHHRRV